MAKKTEKEKLTEELTEELGRAMSKPLSDRSVDSSDYWPPERKDGESIEDFMDRYWKYRDWYEDKKKRQKKAKKSDPELIPGSGIYPKEV